MNRIPIALFGSAMLCAMAWLVGSEDVINAATWGTICVGAAALCVLWRDSLRGVFARRSGGGGAAAPTSLSAAHIALAIVLLLLFAASRSPHAGFSAIPWDLLGLAAGVCAILYVLAHTKKRRRRPPAPPTPRRSRSSWTPPAPPDHRTPDSPDDMGKTRPMPPM